jgi:hypothetical protein
MLDRHVWIAGLMLTSLVAPSARAQSQEPEPSEAEAAAAPAPEPAAQSPEVPAEKKDGRWYVGGFYRHTFTPAFMLKPFLQEVSSTNNPGAGLEVMYGRKKIDISLVAYWQRYHTYGPFLADGDPALDTEMIDSSLSMAAVGGNFLWTSEFNEKFAFQYGLDVAVGYVFGDLYRTEAYPTTDRSTPGYKDGWAPCLGVGMPDAAYCDGPPAPDGGNGGHYNVKTRRWTGGGSVPNAWFRLGPHLALRYTPAPWLRVRVDGGFDLFSGFFVGGMLAFGL